MLEAELNSNLLKNYDYTLDEVKKAQKATHGKIETTDGEKQTTETADTSIEQVKISNATENEIDKEEKEEQTV